MKTQSQSNTTLEDINDVSELIASCFSVPNVHIEKYYWVHTIYLQDEEGVGIGEIIVSRCDQSGLTYDISIPDYDRRNLLLTVNIQTDNEQSIKERLMVKWNNEITWKIWIAEKTLRDLCATLINWKMT